MNRDNIFYKIILIIKGKVNKRKTIGEPQNKENEINQAKTKDRNLTIQELEELQYELENDYITEEELSKGQKEQLKELYNKQIREIEQDINYIKYEYNTKNS